MSLWGKIDRANNAPKYMVFAVSNATGNVAFSNTTVGAFIPGVSAGIFGVTPAEANTLQRGVSPGWVVETRGTGPVTSLRIANGGVDYANSDKIRISGGTTNATGTLTTNSTGGITSVTLVNPGAGFINVANSTLAVTNATNGSTGGSNASITFTLGGRAGRINYETQAFVRVVAP